MGLATVDLLFPCERLLHHAPGLAYFSSFSWSVVKAHEGKYFSGQPSGTKEIPETESHRKLYRAGGEVFFSCDLSTVVS